MTNDVSSSVDSGSLTRPMPRHSHDRISLPWGCSRFVVCANAARGAHTLRFMFAWSYESCALTSGLSFARGVVRNSQEYGWFRTS